MQDAFTSVAVFLGSRFGNNPAWRVAAEQTGRGLAEAGLRLIYGGGNVGLMGVVADAALAAGGAVSGVIPHFLQSREVMHQGVSDLVVTESMHARKQRMFAEADAFLILPGGLGTFDEFFEILTWKQLRLHDKPILVVDVAGWGAMLVATIDRAIADGFADASARALFEHVPDVQHALDRLAERAAARAPTLAADPGMF